jgi:hypothetical protein
VRERTESEPREGEHAHETRRVGEGAHAGTGRRTEGGVCSSLPPASVRWFFVFTVLGIDVGPDQLPLAQVGGSKC